MTQSRRFEDQVVVITGSAKGIGFATAELAAKEGAKVVICDLERDAVTPLCSESPRSSRRASLVVV